MTNEEILKKAIEKAVKNGFNYTHVIDDEGVDITNYCYRDTIFRHDFAKAFWGEEKVDDDSSMYDFYDNTIPAWKYHLKKMVLEEDPIAYLAKYI